MKSSEALLERAGAGPHAAATTMSALVYHGAGRRSWEEKPKPRIREATDAVVRITTTTICGTDLHILKGDVPSVTDGRILGHEGVGIVEEIGTAVTGIRKGDTVLISCITSCGRCAYCKRGMYSHCKDGGWILVTPSTARRPSTCASRTRTRASTTSRRRRTWKRWSCSATSSRPASSAAS